jgi:hypothetical protein
VSSAIHGPRESGAAADLGAIRRHLWLPAAALVIAVAAALIIGAVRPGSDEARLRVNVVVDALPPLFGPAVAPGPFDYARLATSDAVVAEVAQKSGLSAEQLRPRLSAEPRFNRPEIDLKVTGGNALGIARTWQRVLGDAAARQTPVIERLLVQPYARQLDEASALLQQRAAAAKVSPDDAVAQQQLKAAEENYETASKLSQSYDVVANTMTATMFTVVAPHAQSAGARSTAGRLGAAVAVGLLAGVIGALALDYAIRRRTPIAGSLDDAPASIRRRAERRTGSTPR